MKLSLLRGRPLLYAILLTCLSLAACSPPNNQNTDSALQHLAAAGDFQQRGLYQSAVIESQKALQLDPTSLDSQILLAELLMDMGQATEAIKFLTGLPTLERETQLLLARAYLKVGKARSSEDILDQFFANDSGAAVRLLRARIAMSRSRHEQAAELLSDALQTAPDDLEIELAIANNDIALRQYDKANARLEKLKATHGDDLDLLLLQARLEALNGDLAAEETILMQVISILPRTDVPTPNRIIALSKLRDNLFQQGRADEAIIYAGMIQEHVPGAFESEAAIESVVSLLEAGDFLKAKAELETLTLQQPDLKQAKTMLAVVNFLEGDNESVSLLLGDIVDGETSDAGTLQMFAVSELKLGQPQRVIDLLEKDIEHTEDGRLFALYGIALANAGRLRESEPYFRSAIELEPDVGRLYLPLANLHNNLGQPNMATEVLTTAFEKSPSDPVVQRFLISHYLRTSQIQQADTTIKGLASAYPNNAKTQLIIANYYLNREQFKPAEAALNKVLAAENSSIAQHQLASLNLKQGRYEEAKSQFKTLIDLDGTDDKAYRGLMTAYELSKETANGIAELERLASQPDTRTAALVLSEYYGRKGAFEQADNWLKAHEGAVGGKKLRLTEAVILGKARALMGGGKNAEGIKMIRDGLEQYPNSGRLLGALTTIQIAENKLAQARETLSRLKQVDQASFVYLLEGDIEFSAGNFMAARSAYGQAWLTGPGDQVGYKLYQSLRAANRSEPEIRAFFKEWRSRLPDSQIASMSRAGYLTSIKDTAAAIEAYEAILTGDPDNIVALNNLAWLYAENNPATALTISQRAHNLAPNQPDILDTHGWLLHRNGRSEDGLKLLLQAASGSPNNQSIQQRIEKVRATLN